MLFHPDKKLRCILDIDVSDFGYRCILHQLAINGLCQ